MDLNYYLNIMDFNAEIERFIEIHGDNLTETELKRFNITAIMHLIPSMTDADASPDVDEKFEELSANVERKCNQVRKDLNISKSFGNILNQFYRYRYDLYYMDFDSIDDLMQYIDDLFNCLDNNHQKNFPSISDDASEDDCRFFLMDKYNDLIVEYFKKDLYVSDCHFVPKIRILERFGKLYDGESFEAIEYMEIFSDCHSFEDLFKSLNTYCQELIYPDDDGNPSDEDFTDGLILDCIKWRL